MKLFIFENVYPVSGGDAHAVVVAEALDLPALDPDVQPDRTIDAPCLEFVEFHE